MSKVIAGPGGHWYALSAWERGDFLVGKPMDRNDDPANPPEHPHISDPEWLEWYAIDSDAFEDRAEYDALVTEMTAKLKGGSA